MNFAASSAVVPETALLKILMLAGFGRTVSYRANALRLPPEPGYLTFQTGSARNPDFQPT